MQERQVAKKLQIRTINTGKFIKINREVEENKFTPNYIEIEGNKIARVRVLATIMEKFVSESGDYATLTLDDTTDTIRCKIFGNLEIIENIEKGDIVDIIGKIREYNGEIYIQPEIIVKIEDPNFEVLRKLEIEKLS